MMMWKFALFFTIVGAMAGIVDYSMNDIGGTNWFDQDVPDMQVIDISSSDVNSMEFKEGGAYDESTTSIPKYVSILWNVIKGILGITFMLDDFLVLDVGGVNIFAPILYSFQAIIYLIYIMGSIQFITNRSTKGME